MHGTSATSCPPARTNQYNLSSPPACRWAGANHPHSSAQHPKQPVTLPKASETARTPYPNTPWKTYACHHQAHYQPSVPETQPTSSAYSKSMWTISLRSSKHPHNTNSYTAQERFSMQYTTSSHPRPSPNPTTTNQLHSKNWHKETDCGPRKKKF